MKKTAIIALVCLAVATFAVGADASANRNPASLLLFPYYNTNPANLAVITITNTCSETVYVRLVWVDENSCTPEDQWIELTGKDTYTFLDRAQNPEQNERGFMYAYVVDADGSIMEKASNCLIGQEFIFSTWNFPGDSVVSFGINAVGFQAVNLTPDGKLHLDGNEYTAAPKTIYFPRFFGQDGNVFTSQAIFINLTGGQFYSAQVNILVYNDNEQAFSTTFEFPCFTMVPLADVSGATLEEFLMNTNHDPLELWDGNANPLVPHKKTGWLEATGDYAHYLINQIDNASFYAVLIENVGGGNNIAADLPWQIEDAAYDKAMLWSTNPNGN